MDVRHPAAHLLADIDPFTLAAGRQLRAYQLVCARAIVAAVLAGRGGVFTVMFARQMGKNETSAAIEAYLLAIHSRRGGSIVKAAPAFKPQIITSMLRLQGALEANPLTRGRHRPRFGYMTALGEATITFLSADPQANVVGATASLLLEIDEAQDVDPGKYDRDFRPMAAATNATTVLYGTSWDEDSLLEHQRRLNLAHEVRTGERWHFEFDWRTLAAISPPYDAYVRGEIARLGADHPTVQTQYLLRALTAAGRLFSPTQRQALEGRHTREREPRPGVTYVAGIDLAGEDEEAEDAVLRALRPRRDTTVITIAAVERDAQGVPAARVVEHVWWTGHDHLRQYEGLVALWQRWGFRRVAVDASGVGAGIASFLGTRFGDRVDRITFSAPVKSALAYGMLGMVNTGRLTLYAHDGTPEAVQMWREIEACRYRLRGQEQLQWGVPPEEGHDDFVVSLALCARAAEGVLPPVAGGLLRASEEDV